MTYQEAEAYINDTPRFTTKNTLENTKAVLEKMGHPERRMKLIHVAGSNGKGSVCAYLSARGGNQRKGLRVFFPGLHAPRGGKADWSVHISSSGGYQ